MKSFLLSLISLTVVLSTTAQTQFQKATGTSGVERNYHIATTKGGNIIATGYTDANSSNKDDAFLVKYNQFGKVIWSQTYGDAGDDYSWDVIVTNNNDILGCGYTSSFNTGHSVATLTLTDSTGKIKWLTGALNLSFGVEFYRIIETSNGEFLAAGLSGSSSNGDEMVVCKFTSKGRLIWAKNIGTNGSDEIMGITETSQGHYLFAGLANDPSGYGKSDFAAVKLDTAGNLIWKQIYGDSENERLNSVIEINNHYYFCGWSSSFGQGENDIIVMKTDSAGKVDWVNSYGTDRSELAFNLMADFKDSSIVVAGYTEYFSNSGQTNNRNTILMKIDLAGKMKWSNSFGGSTRDGHWPTGLAMNYDEGYYTMGSTNTFGTGDYDLYLIKTNASGNAGCNQSDPGFVEKSANWKGKTFGSISKANVTSATGSVNGSSWKLSEKNLCCKLEVNEGNDTLLCANDTAKLGSTAYRGYKYRWLYNNNSIGTSSTVEIPFGNSGFYDLEVSAPAGGCATVLRSVEIKNSNQPSTGLKTSYEFCDGDSAQVIISSTIQNPFWTGLNSGDTSSNKSRVFKNTEEYWLNYKNNDGCIFNDTISIINNEQPVFKLHSADTAKTCDSFLVQLPNKYSYFWSHNANLNDSFDYLDSQGLYSVTGFIGNCFHYEELYLSKPKAYEPDLGMDQVICPNDLVDFGFADDSLDITWWDGSKTDSITIDSSGMYWVEITKGNGCPGSDTVLITKTVAPSGLFSQDTFSFKTSIQVKPTTQWAKYTWSTTDTTDTIHVDLEGWYTLTVQDSNGCSFTDSFFARRSVGLLETSLVNAIYPNPASSFINIEYASQISEEQIDITLLDYKGRIVKTWTGIQSSLSVSELESGLYILNIKGEKSISSHRISIQ